MQILELDDPGPGGRLAPEQRAALTRTVRASRRSHTALLVVVRDDAWAQDAPEPVVPDARPDEQHALVRLLHEFPQPVTLYADGRLRGLGVSLALACDVRLLAPTAVVQIDPGTTRLSLAAGLPALLDHRVGAGAHDILWTGSVLSAEQAVARTLATRVVADADEARATVAAMDDPRGGSALKRALRAHSAAALARRLEYQAWLSVAVSSTPSAYH